MLHGCVKKSKIDLRSQIAFWSWHEVQSNALRCGGFLCRNAQFGKFLPPFGWFLLSTVGNPAVPNSEVVLLFCRILQSFFFAVTETVLYIFPLLGWFMQHRIKFVLIKQITQSVMFTNSCNMLASTFVRSYSWRSWCQWPQLQLLYHYIKSISLIYFSSVKLNCFKSNSITAEGNSVLWFATIH